MNSGFFARKYFVIGILVLLVAGCATYYQRNLAFHEYYYKGNYEAAKKELDANKLAQKPRNHLLFLMDKGVVEQQLGNFGASNQLLENAYLSIENYRKNIGLEALSLVSNPMVKPYPGEDFEIVLIHYYKAINYTMLRQFESALVECRRMNIKLNELNDKYKRKNRYKEDAFIENLMGIIYEASGDDNNAFIAYRNAFETYEKDYKEYFGLGPSEQLRNDLLRSAYKSGLRTELDFYENKFNKKYSPDPDAKNKGELVCFWNNGLGPVKSEWSINFTILKGSGGMVTFANEEYGLNFPFYMTGGNGNSSLSDLKLIRVAFPKYTERKPFLTKGDVTVDGKTAQFEVVEDINAIAFKTLQDRMLRELSNSLLRMALKQAAEETARKQNEALGAALSVLNAVTEKADTRNWQTLPYYISYLRMSLTPGEKQLDMAGYSSGARNYTDKRTVTIKPGNTQFELFTSVR